MERVYVIGRDAVPQEWKLGEGETLSMTLVVLPGISCELPLRIDLDGPGAQVELSGVYLCGSDEQVRISVDLRHNVGGCSSHQLFKGIVGGSAKAEFYGRIFVAHDAQQTKALQENHNLLLSETARVETRPQLEIYADDVECSHGATIGSLNADEQFYMRSRGIPEAEARVLQMISFIAPVLSHIGDEALREEVIDQVTKI